VPIAFNEALDAEQEAWVRRFVEMALIDAEDEIDGDSDDDINFMIR
jgi:E3 ubiquitin-protein ligase RNF14